jgi:hypothetical protein
MAPASLADARGGAVAAAVTAVVLSRLPELLAAGGLAPLVAAVALALAVRPGAEVAGPPAPWEAPLRATAWAMTAAAVTAPQLADQGLAALVGVVAAVVAAGPLLPRAAPVALAALGVGVLAPWTAVRGDVWTLLEPRWAAAPAWWAGAIGLAALLPGAGLSVWAGAPTQRWTASATAALVVGAAATSAAWWPSSLDDHPGAAPLMGVVALAAWPAAGAHGGALPAAALLVWITLAAPAAASWWWVSGLPLTAAALLAARARRGGSVLAWVAAGIVALAGAAAWPAPSTTTEAALTGGTAVGLAWWTAARALRRP